MTLGPVMLDFASTVLAAEDRELLAHPSVGGVILFSRNYESPAQLAALTADIRSIRQPPLIIAVDQEGGRVQRFRDGFTRLPPARQIGRRYDILPADGRHLARRCGWLMAAELRSLGVDMSFAPVVDLDWGMSDVIGDRAFHASAEAVSDLAHAYMNGMRDAGMAATAKHFPGHGAVAADSHVRLPVDRRYYEDIAEDIAPYERLIRSGLAAVMMAHIVYEHVDVSPAGFSHRWIGEELRQRLGFRGAVFSDDLGMAGAAGVGDMAQRARLAVACGCDMVLVCNDRPGAESAVDALATITDPVSQSRLPRLHGRPAEHHDALLASERWREAREMLAHWNDRPSLELDA